MVGPLEFKHQSRKLPAGGLTGMKAMSLFSECLHECIQSPTVSRTADSSLGLAGEEIVKSRDLAVILQN